MANVRITSFNPLDFLPVHTERERERELKQLIDSLIKSGTKLNYFSKLDQRKRSKILNMFNKIWPKAKSVIKTSNLALNLS